MEPGEHTFIGGKKITHCEFCIIRLVMRGLTRKQIAAALGKSEDTIDQQMWRLYLKLGIQKVTELIIWARDAGFDAEGNYKPGNMEIPAQVVPKPKPRNGKKHPTKK